MILALILAAFSGDALDPADFFKYEAAWELKTILPRQETPPDFDSLPEYRRWLADFRRDEEFRVTGRVLFGVPCTLLEAGFRALLPAHMSINGISLFDAGGSRDEFSTIFLRQFLKKENDFLSGLPTSYFSSMGVELGEPYRIQDLQHYESRILVDVLRKSYRERFHAENFDLDAIRNSLGSGDWVDLVAVPVLAAASFSRFGLDRRLPLDSVLTLGIRIEKGSRVLHAFQGSTVHRVASLWVGAKDFPVSLILSLYGTNGGIEPAFIGLGTDLNVVIEAINGVRPASPEAK